MILRFKKDDLLAALEATRAAAVKHDRDALTKHAKEEVAYLKAFRAACRDALKWDYEAAKKRGFEARVRERGSQWKASAPACPTSRVQRLDRSVAMVKASGQTRFSIQANGSYALIFDLLTVDMPKSKGLC